MLCNVGSIRQVQKQLVQDGYHVSEYALRRWVQDGAIPSVRSGKKRLIVYHHVVEYLTGGTVAQSAEAMSI